MEHDQPGPDERRAAPGRRHDDPVDAATVPAWAGLAVLAAMLLWTAGPWVGLPIMAVVALLWYARRTSGVGPGRRAWP